MSFTVRRLKEKPAPKKSARAAKSTVSTANKLKGILSIVSLLLGPLLEIGHLWNEQKAKEKKHQQRINLLKRIMIILIAILCASLLFVGTARALVALKVLSLQNLVSVAGSNLQHDQYGHTNILLLGQGDATHEGVDLTDTMMIASLDPDNTKSAVMLSLPRDLYLLQTQKMGKGKINSLYRDYKTSLKREGKSDEEASKLAMRELADEVGKILNIPIHYIVKADFTGFVQAVDAIGGVDVVVPADLLDTEYPVNDSSYGTFAINAGPQHLDGETALKYARSRHSTSDFDRSARQQQILQAVANKVKSEGILTKPGQILDLLGIMKEHVVTTLEVRDMVSLAGLAKKIDHGNIIGMQLNTANGLYGSFSEPGGLLYTPPRDQFDGASVLLPVSIPENPVTWKQVQALAQLLINERTAAVEKAPIRIWNTGAEPGSARRLGGELVRYGFNVITTENAPEKRERPDSAIVSSGSGATAKMLHSLLGYGVERDANGSSVSTGASLITIELGKDFRYGPLQDKVTLSSPTQ